MAITCLLLLVFKGGKVCGELGAGEQEVNWHTATMWKGFKEYSASVKDLPGNGQS